MSLKLLIAAGLIASTFALGCGDDDASSTTAAPANVAPPGPADSVAQAQISYGMARGAISEGRFDDAQKAINDLKGMRDKIPAEWQKMVDQLGPMLAEARAKGVKAPATPQ